MKMSQVVVNFFFCSPFWIIWQAHTQDFFRTFSPHHKTSVWTSL